MDAFAAPNVTSVYTIGENIFPKVVDSMIYFLKVDILWTFVLYELTFYFNLYSIILLFLVFNHYYY